MTGQPTNHGDSDRYGDVKLRCEEFLRAKASDRRHPFALTCLRLADVIGPRDNTGTVVHGHPGGNPGGRFAQFHRHGYV